MPAVAPGLPDPFMRRWSYLIYSGSGTVFNSIGLSPSSSGTVSSAGNDVTYGMAANIVTAATTDSRAEEVTGGAPYRVGRNLTFKARTGLHEVGTGSHRMIAGFMSGTGNSTGATSGDIVNATNMMLFSYSTSRGNNNWWCMIGNSGSNHHSEVDSGVAVVADALYDLVITNDDNAGTTTFSINGTPVCGGTAYRPVADTMNAMVSLRTLENAAKNLRLAMIYAEGDK